MFKVLKNGILKKGIVTDNYPAEPYPAHPGYLGMPSVDKALCDLCGQCEAACPSKAISIKGQVDISTGRCVFCGACRDACPRKAIVMTCEFELASRADEDVDALGRRLEDKVKRMFGRSLSIREVDAGSCNGCEVEVNALSNAIYDIERFGLHIVASPRHADMLLVTGPVTRNMEHALRQTYDATPEPKLVVAMGACAISGGIFRDSYAVMNGVGSVLPVDAYIPGCPPSPHAIIQGIMLALDKNTKNTK